MSRGTSGRNNIYASSRSPSDDRTLYYSPVLEGASSLGATQLVTAPRSTGESRNASVAPRKEFGLVTHIFRSAISAFKPFKRPSPVKAAVTRVLDASPHIAKPTARYANPVNWLHLPWESPKAMEHSQDDENAKGPRASGSSAHPQDALVNILGEKNGGARRHAPGTRCKSTKADDLKRTLNKKIQKPNARIRQSDSSSTARMRECVNCGVQGDSKIHWRRSYDELSSTFGQFLCDKCGKAESRMLAKRKKCAAAMAHTTGGLSTHR